MWAATEVALKRGQHNWAQVGGRWVWQKPSKLFVCRLPCAPLALVCRRQVMKWLPRNEDEDEEADGDGDGDGEKAARHKILF